MNKYFLFFDFDGVLVSWRDWNLQYFDPQKEESITQRHINQLDNKVLKTIDAMVPTFNGDVYFIPTSSWCHIFNNLDIMQQLFQQLNLKNLKVWTSEPVCKTSGIHKKDTAHGHLSRPLFIKDFIRKYRPKDYLIFDDEYFEGYIKLCLKYIPCDVYEGITHKGFEMFMNYTSTYWAKLNVVNKNRIERNKHD